MNSRVVLEFLPSYLGGSPAFRLRVVVLRSRVSPHAAGYRESSKAMRAREPAAGANDAVLAREGRARARPGEAERERPRTLTRDRARTREVAMQVRAAIGVDHQCGLSCDRSVIRSGDHLNQIRGDDGVPVGGSNAGGHLIRYERAARRARRCRSGRYRQERERTENREDGGPQPRLNQKASHRRNPPQIGSLNVFVDPGFAPGTGTPEVGGPSSRDALRLVRGLRGLDIVGFDLVEVQPQSDQGEVTSLLAGTLLHEFLTLLAVRRRSQRSAPTGDCPCRRTGSANQSARGSPCRRPCG